MKEAFERELAVFSAARQLRAGERAAYLDQTCAGDPALRQRVEELLRAGEDADGFLQEPAPGALRPDGPPVAATLVPGAAAPGEKAGDRIGHYKLLQQIGEGGCGLVYMAEQEEPVRRRVALKVIKLGMDTKQVIARFEAERQALAMMDHPNIARVLDAGATETGRPYFVMELVRGIKITDYCDEHNLSTKERLEVFMQVCHAVQHAHQKGIIHRDLKPSNILVASNDGVAVPKVIDFGIAKATQGRLTDQTLFTAFEQFIGTPAYMSPEQAELTMQDVDTRTDIYSLGVLLYELLTGRTPFDAQELLASGLDAMRRTIREQEPERPSTKLSTLLAEELTTTAKHRHTEAARLIHSLRGDLDWIVMKCLEKDRARRYDTANGLAHDVKRHLNCEPVVARPPSRLYEFQKTVRRHKFGFAAATALIAVLAAGVVVSTLEAIRAKRAEHFAETARLAEAEQRSEAERQRAYAEANFQKARKTVDEYFTTISETTLLEAPGLQPLRKRLLEAALSYYEGFLEQARDNPELLADLAAAHLRLSVVYISLDRNDDAVAAMLRGLELVEQAIQKRPGDADFPRRLAGFFKMRGDIYTQTRPPSDPIKAANTLQKAADIWQQFARDNPAMVEFQSDLAGIYVLLSALFQSGDDFDRCLAYALRSRAILEELVRARPAVAAYQDLLVLSYSATSYPLFRKGRTEERDQICRQAVRYFEHLAQDVPAESSVRRSLARVYMQLAGALENTQPSEAESTYRRALGLLENLVAESPANPHYRKDLYESYNHLTGLLSKAGRNDEGEALASKALPINEQLVLEFPGMPDYRLDLAERYLVLAERMKESHPLEAEQAYRRALVIHEKLVTDFPEVRFMDKLARNHKQLISLLRNTGKSQEEIEKCYRQDIARYEKWGTNSPTMPDYWQELAHKHNTLGIFLRNGGRKQEAAVELHKAQELWQQHPDRAAIDRAQKAVQAEPENVHRWHDLGVSFFDSGEWQAATAAFEKCIQLGGSAWQWFFLAMGHWQLDNREEARRWFYKSIGWMDDAQEGRLLERQAEAAALIGLPDPGERSQKASTYFKQGRAYQQQGEMEKAKEAYGQAIALYETLVADFPMVPAYSMKLIDLLTKTGRQQEVEEVYRQALAMCRKLPDVASTLSDFSFLLREEGKLPEAEATAREALAIRKKMLGSEHADVAQSLHLLAWNLSLEGKLAEAETLSREEVAMWRKLLGNDDPNVAWALGDLTVFLRDQGKTPEAETTIRESLAIRQGRSGYNHQDATDPFRLLAELLHAQGKDLEIVAFAKQRMELKPNRSDAACDLGHGYWQLAEVLTTAGRLQLAETVLREALDVFEKAARDFPAEPFLRQEQAFSHRRLGDVLGQLGRFGDAEPEHREALRLYWALAGGAPQNALYRRDAASTTWSLVNLLLLQRKLPEAEQVCRAEVDACEKANREIPENIDIRNEQAQGRRLLATVLGRLGRVDEAEREYRACIALYPWLKAAAPGNPFYRQEEGYATWTLAELLEAAGRLDAAETEYRNAIALHEKASADFPNEAGLRDRLDSARSRLVGFLRRRGRLAEARTVAQDAAQKCQAALTNYEKLASDPNRQRECWSLAIWYETVGELLRGVGQAQEAEKAYRDAQAVWLKLLGTTNTEDYRFHLAVNYDALGLLLREAGRATESLESYRNADAIWVKLVAEFNQEDRRNHLGWTRENIGSSLKDAKRFEEASEAFAQALAVWRKLVADFDKEDYRNHLAGTLAILAETLRSQGKVAEAESAEREAADRGDAGIQNNLAWRLATDLDPKNRDGTNAVIYAEKAVTATSRTNAVYLDTLAAAYAEAGRFTDGVRVQQEAIALLSDQNEKLDYRSRLKLYESKQPYRDHGVLAERALALLNAGQFEKAEPVARECLRRREIEIPDDWRTFNARSLLGGTLLGQKKFADAEPLLVSGYQGLKQREDKIPKDSPRIKEALQRLVQFCEATGQPDKGAEWKQKLAELNKAAK